MDVMSYISWPAAATVAVYLASLIFYRLLLHPLSRFPGPKLAAISRWYEAYYDAIQEGQYTFKISEMHKKYGIVPESLFLYPFHTSERAGGCGDRCLIPV